VHIATEGNAIISGGVVRTHFDEAVDRGADACEIDFWKEIRFIERRIPKIVPSNDTSSADLRGEALNVWQWIGVPFRWHDGHIYRIRAPRFLEQSPALMRWTPDEFLVETSLRQAACSHRIWQLQWQRNMCAAIAILTLLALFL
jgi:hypothetical protein